MLKKKRSDYLQNKHLIEKKEMVQSVEIAIGNRTESQADHGKSVMKYVNDIMQYIPIIETIAKVIPDTNNFINYEDQHDKVKVVFDEEFGRYTLREYCFAEDVKKSGFTKILETLLYGLKLSESDLDVKINGQVKFMVGALTMWSGDSLGIH
ncbi:hypothetical protein SNE40_023605 [Patella caerulea]|uniref:Uncharacterized protein n=1 Tax=Patella caerulea TaxID=87958 RepID=A0AAN8GAC5_PATCE